jgi:hypothetical protein
MRDERRDRHEIAGTVADHLIGDVDVTALSVTRLGVHGL